MLVSVLSHSIVDLEYHGAVCHRLNVCNSVCVDVVIWVCVCTNFWLMVGSFTWPCVFIRN